MADGTGLQPLDLAGTLSWGFTPGCDGAGLWPWDSVQRGLIPCGNGGRKCKGNSRFPYGNDRQKSKDESGAGLCGTHPSQNR